MASAWSPTTLTTSPGAVAVFDFDPNDSADIVLAANGAVQSVKNALYPVQYLTAEVATGGNPVVMADNVGADGKRRLLRFQPTKISPDFYDPTTNWLIAGGVNGPAGSGLVNLANSANLSTSGSFTTIIALDIDKDYTYAAGPIWGGQGPLRYTQIRYNGGTGRAGGDVIDSNLNAAFADQPSITAGWHVMTMIKSAGTIAYRLDGQQMATTQVTSTLPFNAQDFMIGGGFPVVSSESSFLENGVPPLYVGAFQAYSGVLAGSDLANAEIAAGASIGLSLNPNPGNITAPPVFDVVDVSTGATRSVAGTPYTGAMPGVTSEFISVTPDSLVVGSETPNVFVYAGGQYNNIWLGNNTGTNVLDGGTNSDLMTGGSGQNSFFVDDINTNASTPLIWATVNNFHAGDQAVIWGVTQADFALNWIDNTGNPGYLGLTAEVTAAGKPQVFVDIVGYSSADLANGRLSVGFSGAGTANPLMYIAGN